MSKIPTAEEFLQDSITISHFYNDRYEQMMCFSDDVQKAMIEFARKHVITALKEASENMKLDSKIESEYQGSLGNEEGLLYVDKEYFYIDKDSIINAYPLENIK